MATKILKVFLVIVLLSLPTSGQNSQQHLICKNIENVFSDAHDDSAVSHSRIIQARTGKRGPAGVKGERGLPGVQGQPGSPAFVNYERIFQVIEKKHREGMREMESRFEELKRNITQIKTELMQRSKQTTAAATTTTTVTTDHARGQRCTEEDGLPYDGNCYFTPHLSSSRNLNYNQAVQKCSSRNSMIAELHSLAHQKAIQDFFRSRIPSSVNYIFPWIGMTYQQSENNLRFRSGKEVSVNQFKWYSSFPSGSHDKIGIYIRNDDNSDEGIFNFYGTYDSHGVICEKPL